MLCAGVATLGLAVYAWRQGHRPSVRAFGLLTAAIALWVLCISFWTLSPPELAIFWFWLQFLGVASVPVLLLIYVLEFTGRGAVLTARWLALLWAVPVITQLLAWTNGRHHLMFVSVDFARAGDYTVLQGWEPGPWFLLYSSYSFSLVAVSMALMARAALKTRGLFRRQIVTLLLAIAPAAVLAVLNTFELLAPDQVVTPLGFLLSGAAIVWSILRHQMISVAPVARELLIEQMDDGMIVLDEEGRIVDLNPAMAGLLARARDQLLSRPLEQALADLPALLSAIRAAQSGPAEVELPGADGPLHYDMRLSDLLINRQQIGRLVVLRDITRLKKAQAELFRLATTDSLTGLSTRRQFFELARPQLELAARQRLPLALILFDIDGFKQVNDAYGHLVGDIVLAKVGARTAAALRASDLICRYGGEEFVALLANADMTQALIVAERLRAAIADQPIVTGEGELGITISIGLAICPPGGPYELTALLQQADQAMYRAKDGGRNRVAITRARPDVAR